MHTQSKLAKMTDNQLRKAYEAITDAAPSESVTRERLIASILEMQSEAAGATTKEKRTVRTSKGKAVKPEKTVKAEKANVCAKCKERKPKTPRARFCRECWTARRKEQLRKNNITWRKRIEEGKAKHHLTYRGKPTVWAAVNKEAAIKQAKRMLKRAEDTGRTGVKELAAVALKVVPKAKPPEPKPVRAPKPAAVRKPAAPRRQGKAA